MNNLGPRPAQSPAAAVLCRLTVLLMLTTTTTITHAQDTHYWSPSYGPGGFLAPGATIANNGDSGVFFYNPALLAFSHKSAASISGTIYQYQRTKIKNGAGTGLNLVSSGGSIIPQMISNTISLKLKKKPMTFGYALLHEPVMDFTTSQRKDAQINALSDGYSPGAETFVGQYTAQNSIDETAGNLSAAIQLSPSLSVGFTIDGRLRKQTISNSISARAIFNDTSSSAFPPIASAMSSYLNTNTHIGVRFKAGLAYEATAKDHFGLLISSPLLHISGSATIVADDEINNIKQDTSFTFYLLASSRQTKLKTRYRTPLSLALGYTHDFDASQFFFSAEYFLRVKQYNVVTPRNEAFIRPDTVANSFTSDLIKLIDARNAVFNIGIGFSHRLTSSVTGFFSVRTDFSYAVTGALKDPEYGIASNTSDWDLYHMQLGANLKKRKFNLRMGVLLAYGHTSGYLQPVNYDNPNEGNLLLGDAGDTKATRLSAGLMMSYIHNL